METLSQTTVSKYGPIKKVSDLIGRLNTVLLITMLLLVHLLSGCAGMWVDSLARSGSTDKKYTDMAKTLAPPPLGHGRLYVYRTSVSSNLSLQIGMGLQKQIAPFTVDDTAYELIWEAFQYFDLSEGQYEITSGTDIVTQEGFWNIKYNYQKGTNRIQVSVANASEVFVRLDSMKEKPSFYPILVENEQARAEIAKLPYQFNSTVGKISITP